MDSILVLGLIPGTNIQISFGAWIALMLVLAVAFKLYKRRIWAAIEAVTRQLGHYYDIYVRGYLEHYADRYLGTPTRQPLHASQLHRRLPRPAR
ncbi:MAG TPA: hypothetical protein VHA37_03565 [Candidatus Saccharimonadales bacterium]|nr:hypothetical protein [Candidatus Saccharimonadales bacterium]